jgi:hypothetical protein
MGNSALELCRACVLENGILSRSQDGNGLLVTLCRVGDGWDLMYFDADGDVVNVVTFSDVDEAICSGLMWKSFIGLSNVFGVQSE